MPRPIVESICAQSLIIWSLNSLAEPEGPWSISLVQLVQLPPVFQQLSETERREARRAAQLVAAQATLFIISLGNALALEGWSDEGGITGSRYAMNNKPIFLTYVQFE